MKGIIQKLHSSHEDIVQYKLPIGDQLLAINPLIGKKVKLTFDGEIRCLDTGNKIKHSFGDGYSWESYNTLARCDECILKPELCHFAQGTCREPEWGEANCMQPHIVYLANSSEIKVGITRKNQIPTRWIDQGASEALPLLEVKDRLTSGLIEVQLAKKLGDKTNWRKMLKNEIATIDLKAKASEVISEFGDLFKKHGAKVLDEKVFKFNYPVEQYPDKVSIMSLLKRPVIEGILWGIKGQYLIFDCGVINIRRHQGYVIQLDV